MSSSAATARPHHYAHRGSSSSSSSSGGGGSNSCSENLPPRTLARLAREVRDLNRSPPEGVRLIVDEESGLPTNLGELMAELEGPQGTPYEGKFFVFKLVFDQEFPASPPRGFFLTKIYHPNVDMSTGAICVNTLKKDWSPTTTLSHVLAVIRCLLIVPFPESSLNDEAGKLFMDSYHEYAKRARLMADVHGRAVSAATQMNTSGGTDNNNDEDSKPAATDDAKSQAMMATDDDGTDNNNNAQQQQQQRVLKNASDNPLRNSNSKKVSKGKQVGKMNKKKSLKRL